jgi:UDP-N-acetyl-D-mannosaminuronic acid dehydrogenase
LLGYAAMHVNEGLPVQLLSLAPQKLDLRHTAAGILGMTFKSGSDGTRDCLSFKLRKLLFLECKPVLVHGPCWADDGGCSLDEQLPEADVLFVGTPLRACRSTAMPFGRIVIDVSNIIEDESPFAGPDQPIAVGVS